MGSVQRTRIKICGLTDPDMAQFAARSGADAIGLVHYAPSPRHVGLDMAAVIARALPPFVSRVALFVDAAPEVVREFIRAAQPDLLQFHGDGSAAYCQQFDRPYIKAVRMQSGVDLLQYASDHAQAKGLLLDAWVDGVAGGSGVVFDWARIPSGLPLPLILSGGLDAVNVGEAIRRVRPWAVDVSSGVERQRGVKDAAKIVQFITGVNDAQG